MSAIARHSRSGGLRSSAIARHSRVGGNPASAFSKSERRGHSEELDSRLRGNDGVRASR